MRSASHIAFPERQVQDQSAREFSLIRGGPTYRIWQRLHLLRPPLGLVTRRILYLPLIAWLPLAILVEISGKDLASAARPFFLDFEVHVRFLIALPLFIAGEIANELYLRNIVRQFPERRIITPENLSRFNGILSSTNALRDSVWPELTFLVLVYTVGPFVTIVSTPNASTWFATVASDGIHYTAAGRWLVLVSIPFFQFILLRWFWRFALWYQLLFRIWRMPLHLNIYHPDKAGGLGFLASTPKAFWPVLVAISSLFAGVIGNRVIHLGQRFTDFKMYGAAVVVMLLVLVLFPLLIFATELDRAKRVALREFGVLASAYVEEFRHRWVHDELPQTEGLLGTPDLQSLADLGNSFFYIRDMNYVPFNKNTVIATAVIILLPAIPLALTMVPFDQIIGFVSKVLF
jgi:hypothetical protein